MFTEPDFLYALAVSLGVGLATAFWLSRSMSAALQEHGILQKIADFWLSVIQLSAVFLPTAVGLFTAQNVYQLHRGLNAASITAAAFGGSICAVLLAAVVVGAAASEKRADELTPNDHRELRQLLLRMREFRAGEIARNAEAHPTVE